MKQADRICPMFMLAVVAAAVAVMIAAPITYVQCYGVAVGWVDYSHDNVIDGNGPQGVLYWSFTREWKKPDLMQRDDINACQISLREPYRTINGWRFDE